MTMSLDVKLLKRAKQKLGENKGRRLRETEGRRAELYKKYPRLQAIGKELALTVSEAMGKVLTTAGNPASAIDEIKDRNLALQAERAEILVGAGYPLDYIDDAPLCKKCGDSGYAGMEICSCLMDIYKEEQRLELSSLLKLGEDTFETFDLDYYSDAPNPVTGVSPRQNMELVLATCAEYAYEFGKSSFNLFLNGNPGLGKTFLSCCIAKVVSEKGFSVVYDTAVSVFAKFEQEKFGRGEDMEEISGEVRRYLNCDLLILDDLGTEMPTSFVTSALYTLINSRLMSGKKTVISSNLALEELRRRYSPQIMSRLEGEYLPLPFYGSDIRKIKRENM